MIKIKKPTELEPGDIYVYPTRRVNRVWVVIDVTSEMIEERGLNTSAPGLHGFSGMWYDVEGKPLETTVEDFEVSETKKQDPANVNCYGKIDWIERCEEPELLYYRRPRNYDPEERIFNVTRQAVFLMVKRYGKKAGIKKRVYPHIFRHSYAVERLKNGLDIRTLQRLLGHTKLDDTATYLQITDFDIRDKVKKASLGW